ncbi:hypothetical protein SRHO_G00186690 [Serrasalmus rhombeus]
MEQEPRQTPGFLGSVPRTVRFQWKDAEAGDAFPDRVPFIREVLFGALGLGTQDLICAQRNNAARFFDVSMSSEEAYRRVLERGVDVRDHPLGRRFELHSLDQNGRRMVTVHLFNPFVTAEAIRTFLRRYGEVQPGERMVRDELGIWNGRRQYMVDFREDGKGGLTHPPAYFSLNGVSPPSAGGACSMAMRAAAGRDIWPTPGVAGVGPVAPRTVGEEGPTEVGAEGSVDLGAPAAAIATSSPGVARGPAPGPHPLADLTILTTNVRGLQKATKRTAVFRDLASTSASICCLQEVHLRDQRDEALFSQEWRRGKAYWSVGGVHSTGVGILFGDRSFEKVSPFTIVQGRALGVDATWRGQNLRVLCVYAPVDPSSHIAFLEALAPFCFTNRHVVVAGDFNINLEGRDDVSVKHLKKLVAGFSLIDGFKFCNPGSPGHTWHNSRGASSRIDYILVAPPHYS